MPPVRTPVVPVKGKGLNAKSVGGLPLWAVVIGGALGTYVLYKVYKNYKSGSGSASPATAPATDMGAGGGAGGLDATSAQGLADALNGLTTILGGGGGGIPTSTSTGAASDPSGSTSTGSTGGSTGGQSTPLTIIAPAPAATAPVSAPVGNMAAGTPGTGTIFINGQDTGLPDTAANAAAVVDQYLAVYGNQPLPWTPVAAPVINSPADAVANHAEPPPQVIPPPPTTTATHITPPAPAATSSQIKAGQAAVNEKPTVVKGRGRAV